MSIGRILVVVDVREQLFESKLSFQNFLLQISIVFEHFRKCCLPFIIILPVKLSVNLIRNWLSTLVKQYSTLRCVFTFMDDSLQPSSNTIHFRPTLDGCRPYSGIYQPKTFAHFQRLQQLNSKQRCDLNHTLLNVAVNNLLPYCYMTSRNGTIIAEYSFELEILRIMSKYFRFRYKLIDSHLDWGMKLPNGEWTGTTGLVVNDSAQLGMCSISYSSKRNMVIDFGTPMLVNELSIVSHLPKMINNDWLMLKPFKFQVWLTLLISMSLLSIMLHRSFHQQYTFVRVGTDLIGIYLKQGIMIVHKKIGHINRILLGSWIICTLILSTGYSSAFYSILTIPQYEKPIDSIDALIDAVDSQNYDLINVDKSLYTYHMIYATRENYIFYKLGQNINRTHQRLIFSAKKILWEVNKNPRYIAVLVRTLAVTNIFLNQMKFIHIARENILPDFTSFIYAKNSPLIIPFNQL
ncbi:hypothetical protein RDWZM_000044 [Blomia tropicalis]|uniref:Ionotropic glutamate receptor L-glutamate and glycine-binding domain-containing protein n=1 Tax=Blomia tropicalis TaxID=40697 RepID=A0A9Q0RP70_BLOTA|nr:hypothetical protein RDWZM_000044 [Blomia tropicalis]